MTDNKATVETLTAEVRVLMLGKKQVTLSVYRQLDTVEPEECEPFGRVRDSQDKDVTAKNSSFQRLPTVYVVGRSVSTGELVRSSRFEPGRPYFLGGGGPTNERDVAEQREYKQDVLLFREWAALPLIVLAGLR